MKIQVLLSGLGIIKPSGMQHILQKLGFCENSYGFVKRVVAVSEWLKKHVENGATVLDVGCGTGMALSYPLALAGYHVLGIDDHQESIDYAQKNCVHPDIRFLCTDLNSVAESFDVVICSEVLEHLENPEEFLQMLKKRLKPQGYLVITVPNGFGPFEIEKFLARNIQKTPFSILFKRWFRSPEYPIKDTLNLHGTPHIQFFTQKRLRRIFSRADYQLVARRNRTLFTGPFTRKLIGQNPTMNWLNGKGADVLPSVCSSGWMFFLQRGL